MKQKQNGSEVRQSVNQVGIRIDSRLNKKDSELSGLKINDTMNSGNASAPDNDNNLVMILNQAAENRVSNGFHPQSRSSIGSNGAIEFQTQQTKSHSKNQDMHAATIISQMNMRKECQLPMI